MMIDRWTDRLSEYLDGELDPRDERLVEAHLADCASCRATLAELRAVIARAAALPLRDPAADLWPEIRRSIEAAPVLPGPRQTVRARRRVSFSLSHLAAAALLVSLVSGGSVWLAMRAGSPDPGQGGAGALGDDGASPIARLVASQDAEQASVAELERVLAANRHRLDPVTVAVLESNLKIIDAAITEAVTALARDPGNPYLTQHLDATMQKKVEVLRRAASIVRAQT
jgi:anti-sigma factor RsiW